ncbi:MAG: flagellar type III secretion system pore protein FliP [Roseburia sp.]
MICAALLLSHPGIVRAASTETASGRDAEDIGSLNVTSTPGEGEKSTSDNNNGLHIIYNNDEGSVSADIKIFLVITIIALAPSILIMLTSYTRIIIVLHFLRSAIGTQTSPPNQVLIGLALFLTIFIMQPVFTQVNENAIKPLDAGEITQEEAFEAGMEPIREFMFGQTQRKDINMFCEIAQISYDPGADLDQIKADIPNSVLIPSFIISELRTAFIIGFLIYIPFIVIDMVVASVLMSMGMMMLPPTTISLPFKILLFILADGWDLVIKNLVQTFY